MLSDESPCLFSGNLHDLNIATRARYRICAKGSLDQSWAPYLQELQLVVEQRDGAAVVALSGPLTDQSALIGVLAQLVQLGLPIISAEILSLAPATNQRQAAQP